MLNHEAQITTAAIKRAYGTDCTIIQLVLDGELSPVIAQQDCRLDYLLSDIVVIFKPGGEYGSVSVLVVLPAPCDRFGVRTLQ